jgi:oligopeptide/dipeptide ABC transporter ATP-binding protein
MPAAVLFAVETPTQPPTQTPTPILDIRGLRASIHGREGVARILDRVDLTLAPGRVVGLVGESGCGKSTLLRAILGLLPPNGAIDAGSIRFEGRDLVGLDEATLRREVRGSGIGFVPQDPYLALNPVFPLEAQLLHPMHGRIGRSRAERRDRLVAMLRRMRLPHPETLLRRYPHQLSGGQRQRLLIGGVLALQPRLVIADEPTTALDVISQRQILALLKGLVRELSLSLLFVTHDLGAAAQLCDETCVMYAGQIVEAGPTRTLIAAPRHPYTAALLACHPDRNTDFRGIPGAVPSPVMPPPGCRFAPRCPAAQPACLQRTPAPRRIAADHVVDCRLFDA